MAFFVAILAINIFYLAAPAWHFARCFDYFQITKIVCVNNQKKTSEWIFANEIEFAMFDNHLLFSFQKIVKEDICVCNLLPPSRQKTKKLIKEDAMRQWQKCCFARRLMFLFLFWKEVESSIHTITKIEAIFITNFNIIFGRFVTFQSFFIMWNGFSMFKSITYSWS